jgi:hypothetical protein
MGNGASARSRARLPVFVPGESGQLADGGFCFGGEQERDELQPSVLVLLKGGSQGRRAPESRSQMSKRKRAGGAGRRPGASSTTLSQLTIDAMADELNHRPRRTHG